MKISNLPWPEVLDLIRQYGSVIGELAKKGNPESIALKQKYQYAHDHPKDHQANLSVRRAMEDWLQMYLRLEGRSHLEQRHEHKIDKELPKIIH